MLRWFAIQDLGGPFSHLTALQVKNLPVDLCKSRASFTVLLRVRSQATGKIVRRTMELLGEDDGFERHDARLEALFPLIMGTNSRPYRAR